MLKLEKEDNDFIIISNYCKTKKFDLTKPVLIEREGLSENLKGVYKLVYLLEEEK
jgi:hypothetical protein